jgi:hypothetical protein
MVRARHLLSLLLIIAPIVAWADPTPAARGQGPLPHAYWLPQVKVDGKVYYRTFRVTSRDGLNRITDKSNGFRFFNGSGQYGEAFYLFRSLASAKKFAGCEQARGACTRTVIAEVLLPKERFDAVAKQEVPKALDWGMLYSRGPAYQGLRGLRLDSHIVYGRWAPSPGADEPFYAKMNGDKQLAVVQCGLPSILSDAIIRELTPKKPR